MLEWGEFADEAPQISRVFERRHTATGYLCMLATLRAEGYPRISLKPAQSCHFGLTFDLAGN